MSRKYALLLALSLTLVLLDQWTKYLVVRDFTAQFDGRDSLSERLAALYGAPPELGFNGMHYRAVGTHTVSESFLRLHYAENPGAAFSMFRDLPKNVRSPFFHLITLGAVVLILGYYRKLDVKDPTQGWAVWGLPLVLGGALGNYVDRLARGFVIDFIQAHWFDRAYWPSFNVADAAICVGVGMLLVDGFVRKEPKAQVAVPSPPGRGTG
ncbi:MAG: signal peptidase II [Myxococcaceae bacterium]|nr:signal peptidase II [Myxococcaceae bacterium]